MALAPGPAGCDSAWKVAAGRHAPPRATTRAKGVSANETRPSASDRCCRSRNLGVRTCVSAARPVADSADISASAFGRAKAEEVAARYRGYDLDIVAADLVVRELADGTLIVAEQGVDVGDLWSTPDGAIGGRVRATADASTIGEPQIASLSDDIIVADAGWVLKSSHCFSRYTKGQSWMDTCWEIDKSTAEQDPAYEYWALEMWATVDAVGYKEYLDYAWLHADRDGGPTFYWYNWSPRTTATYSCQDRTLGITVAGFGFTSSFTWCEKWTVTKYAAPGEIKVQYEGNSSAAREVALFSGIKVQGSGSPVWGVSYNFLTDNTD